jgi:hypothetical protein
MTGTVKVPMDIEPPTGDQSTLFTITWASQDAPEGMVYRVEQRLHGSCCWSDLARDTQDPNGDFRFGSGTHEFRARVQIQDAHVSSMWSPIKTLVVTP